MVNPVDENETSKNTAELWRLIDKSATDYGDLTVVDRDNQIDVSSDYPLTEQRDKATAGVTHLANESEFRIRANAGVESLETTRKLTYSPGYIGEIGLAIRIPQAPTGNQEVRWGYWNGSDGVYYGWDSEGVFMEKLRGGVRQDKTYEENWNQVDQPSFDAVKELQAGTITRLILALYNYGTITGEIFENSDRTDELNGVDVHTIDVDDETTLSQQNLPLRVEVDNPDTTDFDVYLGDRQGTLRGQVTENRRLKGERRTDISLSGTTWVPLLSFRKKSAYQNVDVQFFDVKIKTTDDVYLQLRSGAGSTADADYAAPQNVNAGETAVEVDTTPSGAISDGFYRFQTIAQGGTGSKASLGGLENVDTEVKNQQPATLFARTVSAQGGTVNALTLNWQENW